MTAWTAMNEAVATLCELAEELQIMPREKFDGETLAERVWGAARGLENAQDKGSEEDERVDPETVIAALRLAMFGSEDDNTRVRVANYLLAYAPDTPADDTTGPALLCNLLRDGILTASFAE